MPAHEVEVNSVEKAEGDGAEMPSSSPGPPPREENVSGGTPGWSSSGANTTGDPGNSPLAVRSGKSSPRILVCDETLRNTVCEREMQSFKLKDQFISRFLMRDLEHIVFKDNGTFIMLINCIDSPNYYSPNYYTFGPAGSQKMSIRGDSV